MVCRSSRVSSELAALSAEFNQAIAETQNLNMLRIEVADSVAGIPLRHPIAQVRAFDAPLAESLATLTDEFAFWQILASIQSARGDHG